MFLLNLRRLKDIKFIFHDKVSMYFYITSFSNKLETHINLIILRGNTLSGDLFIKVHLSTKVLFTNTNRIRFNLI